MKDELSELAFAAGWSAVRRLPERAARTLFDLFADQAWVRHGRSIQQLERNLRRVVPDASTRELRELSRAASRSYLRYWCEVFRLPDWPRERVVSRIRVDDAKLMAEALEQGGAVMSLPHMGNWDHAGAWACLEHGGLTTVAERLRPEGLYERFVAYREGLGMEVLPLTERGPSREARDRATTSWGGSGPFRTLLDRARSGRLICLLGDRDLTTNGVPVSFFGETATMPAGPAALSLASGAPLLPVTLWYEDDTTCLRIHPRVHPPETGTRAEKVAALTQACADVFAAGIAKHPEDWHMMQRLWVSDVSPSRGGQR